MTKKEILKILGTDNYKFIEKQPLTVVQRMIDTYNDLETVNPNYAETTAAYKAMYELIEKRVKAKIARR